MTVIGVASMKNSPGVTTFALALAATWPAGEVVLAELDASGGDLAGHFRLQPDPGIASLATELRRNQEPDVLFKHTQALPRGLRVITAPVRQDQAHAALSALTVTLPDVLKKLSPDITIIADLGRLTGTSKQLAASADRVLVLARPRLTELAHLQDLGDAVPHAEVVLVGRGTYPPREVTQAIGLGIRAHIAHDPAAHAFLEGRRQRTRVVRAARRIGLALSEVAPLEASL
ncbi:hypothetical protein ACGFIV_31285 [Sphaerisporangium sp. NPDC049003]|uniref:hypothetical protein n=1 Tax=Sphaerisporangium sp. NPDC049003 TaxID=3364517 RepID=UPI003712E3AF